MSTKCTIIRDDFFHFYNKVMEDDGVYLKLEGADVEYSAAPGSVTVRVPSYVWEAIRRSPGPSFNLVDKSDADLREMVTADVLDRVAKYKAHPNGLAALSGVLVYGDVKDAPEVQIERGIADLLAARERQRALKAKVDALVGSEAKG